MPRSGPPPPSRLLAQLLGSWPHNQGQLLPDVPPQPGPTLAAHATQTPGEEGGGWPLTHREQGWGSGQVRGRWAGHEIRGGLRAVPTMGHCTWLRSSTRRPPSQAQAPAPHPCGGCAGSGPGGHSQVWQLCCSLLLPPVQAGTRPQLRSHRLQEASCPTLKGQNRERLLHTAEVHHTGMGWALEHRNKHRQRPPGGSHGRCVHGSPQPPTARST